MHATNAEADALCEGLRGIDAIAGVEVVLAPAYLQLARVADRFIGSGVGIAGQNMHFEEQGAFTGEVSPRQLAEVADWVIIGHSERRQYFCEDDRSVNAKVRAAQSHGLKPILCVGEQRTEREAERTEAVLRRQLHDGLDGLELPPGFVVAYEPTWAIGTGIPATGEVAQQVSALIRDLLAELQSPEIAETARILYGGSVKAENIAEFVAQPDIDGALVGGASLDAEQFTAITRAIAAAKSS